MGGCTIPAEWTSNRPGRGVSSPSNAAVAWTLRTHRTGAERQLRAARLGGRNLVDEFRRRPNSAWRTGWSTLRSSLDTPPNVARFPTWPHRKWVRTVIEFLGRV